MLLDLTSGSRDLAHTYQLMSFITKRGDIDPYSGAKIVTRCRQAEYVRARGAVSTST